MLVSVSTCSHSVATYATITCIFDPINQNHFALCGDTIINKNSGTLKDVFVYMCMPVERCLLLQRCRCIYISNQNLYGKVVADTKSEGKRESTKDEEEKFLLVV